MPNIYSGALCSFKYGSTILAAVTDLSPSGWTRPEVEKTALGDTSKTYRPSVQFDGGTVDVTYNYDPADTNHAAIKADVHTAVTELKECVITYPDGSTDTFDGFPTSWSPQNMTNDDSDNLSAQVTFKVSGAVVYEAADEGGED